MTPGQWEDVSGEIIELIIEAGDQHRLDGNNLIIAAVDEEVVDTILRVMPFGEDVGGHF